MKNLIKLFVFIQVAGFSVHAWGQSTCRNSTLGIQSMHGAQLVIINDLGIQVSLETLVADDNFERASGFQHICPSVIDGTLILFQYTREIMAQFHMNNVHGPLDIAFFSGSGRLLKVLLMQTYSDSSRPLYGPGEPFKYALEARPGFFKSHNILTSKSIMKAVE